MSVQAIPVVSSDFIAIRQRRLPSPYGKPQARAIIGLVESAVVVHQDCIVIDYSYLPLVLRSLLL